MRHSPFHARITRTENESTSKPRKCHLTQLKPVTQVKWKAELNNVMCHTSQLPKKYHCLYNTAGEEKGERLLIIDKVPKYGILVLDTNIRQLPV
jgi:hypothetical protein